MIFRGFLQLEIFPNYKKIIAGSKGTEVISHHINARRVFALQW